MHSSELHSNQKHLFLLLNASGVNKSQAFLLPLVPFLPTNVGSQAVSLCSLERYPSNYEDWFEMQLQKLHNARSNVPYSQLSGELH